MKCINGCDRNPYTRASGLCHPCYRKFRRSGNDLQKKCDTCDKIFRVTNRLRNFCSSDCRRAYEFTIPVIGMSHKEKAAWLKRAVDAWQDGLSSHDMEDRFGPNVYNEIKDLLTPEQKAQKDLERGAYSRW